MICDSHAHLNHGDAYEADRDEVLERARQAGVACILNVSTSPVDAPLTVDLASREEDVLAAVGIHPHEAEQADDPALEALRRLAPRPEVVAWGEIGLDYHYMNAPRPVQREAFARQLELASELGLPVSVHSREADADTVEILRRHAGAPGGVIHCFTGDWNLATACLDLGFHLSFSGIVTFPRAEVLREVARRTPAERLLAETDSPYLAPAPGRGRRNEPARVVDVIRRLAAVREVSPEEMATSTGENFRRLFQLEGLEP
jgi:TatD DNase family protein